MSILVNGEYVDAEIIRQEAAMVRQKLMEAGVEPDPLALEMRAREWGKENVIERVLLRQAAMTDATLQPTPEEIDQALETAPPGIQADRREIEIRMRVDRLIAKLGAAVPTPSKKDVAAFYQQHRDNFRHPELIRAAHIVKNVDENTDESAALAAIEAARTELEKGRTFAEVADELSDCPGRGGDLGFFPRGEMVEEFDQVVFGQKVGQVGPIFRTPFGFHIARVTERRPEGYGELAEVRGHIEEALRAQRAEKALEEFLDDMRAQADIQKAGAQPA
jgi:parvulin-like peptidyl-prolyl isomerase